MVFEKKTSFDSIPHRILYGMLFAFTEGDGLEMPRREVHALLHRLLRALYENPALLELPLAPDDSYDWYTVNNQRPELSAVYLDIFKRLYQFYRFFFVFLLQGEPTANGLELRKSIAKEWKISYKACYSSLLGAVDITLEQNKEAFILSHATPEILLEMKRLAAICEAENIGLYPVAGVHNEALFDFARCAWNQDNRYLVRRIDDLYQYDGLLTGLYADCLAKGYAEEVRGRFGQTEFSFTFGLLRGVGGFTFGYNPRKTQQFYFGTRNGIGEKKMLDHFSDLDESMRAYFMRICRPCNQCDGCTKGGKNKRFTIKAEYNGQEHSLCPMFPRHEWKRYDRELIDLLYRYHDMQEGLPC